MARNTDIVKPIPPQASHDPYATPAQARRQGAYPNAGGQPHERADSQRLAEYECKHDGDHERTVELECIECNTGVDQRKKRHDRVCNPWMESFLQPRSRREQADNHTCQRWMHTCPIQTKPDCHARQQVSDQ